MESVKHRVVVIGAGSRGKGYADKICEMEDFQVVAVAEPITSRRESMREKHGISPELCFESWEPVMELPRLGDVAIIATMDRDHVAPALAAIEKGYNLLLEKPAGATPEECRRIQRAAEEKGVFVLVCHVLRYTKFFKTLKRIINSGEIGRVMNIQHTECVGNVHQSHSFVRGNWRNSDDTTPMILQKSCHDMDILAWLVGKRCKQVQSFGALTHFTAENAPEGATDYCVEGCPHLDTCPYNAIKLYLDDKNNSWFRTTCTRVANPTDEDVMRAISTTNYGKCVYKCDNNVVDHQVVNMLFEDDIIMTFTMSAFNKGGRSISIMGTKGHLTAAMTDTIIRIYDFETKSVKEIDLNAENTDDSIVGGHGGGDWGIMLALRDLLEGVPNDSACDIRESCDNHLIAFAAEESRLTGKVVDMDEYFARFE